MGEDLITLLNLYRELLTKKEQLIAKFVIENQNEVIHMSITEFAETLKVGEGTVVRFCQKLGFDGFHSFKLFLAKTAGRDDKKNEELNNDVFTVLKINHISTIEQTSELLRKSKETIEKCADLIARCRKLYTIGVGASGATALDAYYKFMRIGIDAFFSQDQHLTAMKLSMSNEKDVVLAFSQSGSTSVIVDLAKIASENKTPVIAVTGHKRSPLTLIAEYIILTPIREAPFESGAIRSKISQLHVLEVLFELTKARLDKSAQDAIISTARAVEKWIY